MKHTVLYALRAMGCRELLAPRFSEMTYGWNWEIERCAPLDAMVLVGTELEVPDFKPPQLGHFPNYSGSGSVLGSDEIIHMGLAHPSH
jgi:hypothetical protein